jgi:hypothetical protein
MSFEEDDSCFDEWRPSLPAKGTYEGGRRLKIVLKYPIFLAV